MRHLKEHAKTLKAARKEILHKISLLQPPSGTEKEATVVKDEKTSNQQSHQFAIKELQDQMKLLRNKLLGRAPVLPSQSAGTQLIYQAKSQANPAAPKYQKHSYEGNSLTQEIRSLRQHYVSNGGTEPSIIDQLSDMILDAERLERGKQRQLSHSLPQTFGVSSSTTPNMAEELMAMEMENYRLQKELLLLENSNRKDSNSNPESTTQNLRTQAWLKVDLFNAKNTLLSGAWKVSFHLPPIRPDLPMSAMTSLPLYSDATLHLRVVNYKDSHSQSDSVISSANRVDYKFPLVMSTGETIPFSWDT
ncbi:CCDC17 [Bugula neritina]|uniref:CCDC17 n=1 Tax=Bugula neritina TaxID=10212 RepID=A0A7J7JTX3_BUGNE|nr:CCDC17 [Bugula neritina]